MNQLDNSKPAIYVNVLRIGKGDLFGIKLEGMALPIVSFPYGSTRSDTFDSVPYSIKLHRAMC
jgi:hypothetical protein